MSNVLSQGVYAPLPQCLSDSDSDRELHDVTADGHQIKMKSNGLRNGNMQPSHVHQQHHNYFTPCATAVTATVISHKHKNGKVPEGFCGMSPTRKCCFIASIALCFLTVIVFVWVLPCSGTCPIKITNWKVEQEHMEFDGAINVVQGAFESHNNIALFYRHNQFGTIRQTNGVISLLGSTGVTAWYITQPSPPDKLDCYVIDVNGDGVKDCFLLGKLGLEVLDPVSGEVYWHLHAHRSRKQGGINVVLEDGLVTNIGFPRVLPDLDGDGIDELITISTEQNRTRNMFTNHSKIMVASGRSGIVIAVIPITTCTTVSHYTVLDKMFIFSCTSSGPSYRVTIDDLTHLARSSTTELIPSDIKYLPPASTSETDDTYTLNNRRLSVRNLGGKDCMRDGTCRVDMHLHMASVAGAGASEELWSVQYSNTVAMRPALFAFKVTQRNVAALRGHLNGFVLKLWQFEDHRNSNAAGAPTYRYDRTASDVQRNDTLVRVRTIFERVILITFNNTNVHLINASLVNITQLCRGETDVCQPALDSQRDSMLIADLDKDGSQELVSYSATYECADGGEQNGAAELSSVDGCQLVSTIKVIRLEAELPKLYESAK